MSIDVDVEVYKFLTDDDDKKIKRWKTGDVLILFLEEEEPGTYRAYCMSGFIYIDVDFIVNSLKQCFSNKGDALIEELKVKGFNCILPVRYLMQDFHLGDE